MESANQELNFKGGNPGAVQHGNFINYYQFHAPEERIQLLSKDVFKCEKLYTAMDIGCNTGELTNALEEFMNHAAGGVNILAIDIDPILIKRAEETNKKGVVFQCMDIMDQFQRKSIICNYLSSRKMQKFNVVFCFSISMWIHLNHGDEGLKSFLKYVSSITETLVIEPQPWKCYKSAVKRMKSFQFPLYSKLSIRANVEDQIENYLITECNLRKISESKQSSWGRKVLVFQQ